MKILSLDKKHVELKMTIREFDSVLEAIYTIGKDDDNPRSDSTGFMQMYRRWKNEYTQELNGTPVIKRF